MNTTIAQKTSAKSALGSERILSSPEDLRRLRQFSASISGDPHLEGCGRTISVGVSGSGGAVIQRIVRCRRKWLCPTCGYAAAIDESRKLGQRLSSWTSKGHSVGLLTLTQHHDAGTGLAVLWDRLEGGWAAAAGGAAWRADRELYGTRGYVRIVEVVHHPVHGWNVHVHALLLLDEALGEAGLKELKDSLAGRFVRRISNRGGGADVNGQDLKPLKSGTEERLSAYCLKGAKAVWSENGSRSPMAILADLSTTGQDPALWEEFATTVTEKRRMQLSTSKRLDSICMA
ncbi:protein rep [Mycobacterium simiae]|uniref:protein rep n=1 Tax=Mycobacterium simiae TaxID=1784 RepID=UPI00111BF4BC|nr:protein rep [Mycobacterium simiae]